MRKYSFTGETKVVFGITLNRIKAEMSFGCVTSGMIGGWIEKRGKFKPFRQRMGLRRRMGSFAIMY